MCPNVLATVILCWVYERADGMGIGNLIMDWGSYEHAMEGVIIILDISETMDAVVQRRSSWY